MTNDAFNFSLNLGLDMWIERQEQYAVLKAVIHSVSPRNDQVPQNSEQLFIIYAFSVLLV